MTRKISVSLPDDVAERLDEFDNVSAVVTKAVRKYLMGLSVRETLTRNGVAITDVGIDDARRVFEKAADAITDETRREAAKTYAEILRSRGQRA